MVSLVSAHSAEILSLSSTHVPEYYKLSFMNVLVQLLDSLRQGFSSFFCAMDPFKSPVKPNDPFSQKCI